MDKLKAEALKVSENDSLAKKCAVEKTTEIKKKMAKEKEIEMKKSAEKAQKILKESRKGILKM